jgi:GTP cyclohydrolase FolE2
MSIISPIPDAPCVIEDVQSRKDTRRIAINKVGIKDIRHPVSVRDRSDGEQHTIACFNMYVNLPHNFKGTHMSRFVEILNGHEKEITVESFKDMLAEMAERLEAQSGHIEMAFPGRDPRRRAVDVHQGRSTGHQPLPLLKEDLGSRGPQPALPRHRTGAHPGLRLD